jgi:HEAT repeat protein
MRIDPNLGTEAVSPLLADPDADVRWYMCGLLYDFGDQRATPQLIEVLRNDPEGHVRLFAADALGKVGDLSAVPALRHAEQFDVGQDHEGRRVSAAAKEAIEGIRQRHS